MNLCFHSETDDRIYISDKNFHVYKYNYGM
jgi:hypothetical protein